MLQRFDPLPMRVDIDGHRHYRIPEIGPTPVPSVTTVLGVGGLDEDWGFRTWRAKLEAIEPGLADRARDVAAARGTRLHAQCTEILVAHRFDRDAPRDNWLESMRPVLEQWIAIATLELADGAVWHGFDRTAGTVDFVLDLVGTRVWDLKTSTKPRDREQLRRGIAQLGGYIEGIRWVYDRDCAGAGLVVALPDRPAQVLTVTTDEAVSAWHEHRERYRETTQYA